MKLKYFIKKLAITLHIEKYTLKRK